MGIELGLLPLLSGGTAIFLGYVLIKIAYGMFVMTRRTTQHIEIVPPDQAPPAPSPQLENALLTLGFDHIGVSWIQAGHVRAHTWYYGDASGEVIAEMIASNRKQFEALVVFITWFQDQAYLWTSYPIGERVETETFQAHYSARSIELAYAHHQRQIAAWRPMHGEPIKRRDLTDLDYYHRLFVEKYHRRYLRQPLIRTGLTSLVLFLMLSVNVTIVILFEMLRLQSFMTSIVDPLASTAQLGASMNLLKATVPYMLHWVIGVVALHRLSTWKAPAIEDVPPKI